MQRRGHDSACERVPWGRLLAVAGLAGVAGTSLLATGSGDQLVVAGGLLFLGDIRRRSGLTALVGSLLAGSLLGAGIGYAATVWLGSFPLATEGGVGLGIALGGGLGVVSNLLAADARADDATGGAESMTVDMQADDSPSPRPADLFDGHPDPVLYVADQGHGPVVLAANDAFSETFDVPTAAISGTPLEEVLLTTDDDDSDALADIADAVAADERVDAVRTCRTPDGPTQFRLRTAGSGTDGYVIYTPTDVDA